LQIIESPGDARQWTVATTADGRVALVPTMGALHDGHFSLIRRAKEIAGHVAVSIFVNPAQFAPLEDLARYPRPIEDDLAALRREGVAMVYLPASEIVYPPGFSTYVEPPAVAAPLEGVLRPGHFRGVCTVVLKLFQTIPAHVAVFGQKDYQQARVIVAMVRDLDVDIEIDVAPTVREPGGLAMSSRNRYLDANQRDVALCLARALTVCNVYFSSGTDDVNILEAAMRYELGVDRPDGVDTVDYAVVVDGQTLLPVTRATAGCVALIAARVGTTRLIDNHILR